MLLFYAGLLGLFHMNYFITVLPSTGFFLNFWVASFGLVHLVPPCSYLVEAETTAELQGMVNQGLDRGKGSHQLTRGGDSNVSGFEELIFRGGGARGARSGSRLRLE